MLVIINAFYIFFVNIRRKIVVTSIYIMHCNMQLQALLLVLMKALNKNYRSKT